ncbi:hypothetical protein K474DRAFT_1607695, partial [Panus rudis PR-1116 ss-1]
WKPSTYRDEVALQFSNKFFTLPQYTQGEAPIPLHKDIDPKGILTSVAQKNDLLHLPDNSVSYYMKQDSSNSKGTFQLCHPQTIQNGFMVEAQVSFLVFPLKDKRYKMIRRLYSIFILSTAVETVCH